MPVAIVTQQTPTKYVGKQYHETGPEPDTPSAEIPKQEKNTACCGRHVTISQVIQEYPELGNDSPGPVPQMASEFRLAASENGVDVFADLVKQFPSYQDDLSMLRQNARPSGEHEIEPEFPKAGERFGDYHLLAELGFGSQGRVFLATQNALADRPLVLKMTPCLGDEHLSLARLQHTNIVPLYAVQDLPNQNLRVLFFPYQGGMTWDRVVKELETIPLAERKGMHISAALDHYNDSLPIRLTGAGKAREQLVKDDYVRAVCRMGVRLAETLHFAHERGLLHLDVKPSNILLADDGEPLLLDFHLAQPPLEADDAPRYFGGTPAYMAPEQRRACDAMLKGLPTPNAVNCRADVYGLGVVLYEALGGSIATPGGERPELHKLGACIPVGLSDVIAKCIHENPEHRYAGASALAGDLQRHLNHAPLRGVPNRSWSERWTKWRCRRPWVLPWLLVGGLLGFGLVLACFLGLSNLHAKRERAESALIMAQDMMQRHRYEAAVQTLTTALEQTDGFGADTKLRAAMQSRLRVAALAHQVKEVRQWTNSLREIAMMDPLPPRALVLAHTAKTAWETNKSLYASSAALLGSDAAENVKRELFDLAIDCADLHSRVAPPGKEHVHYRDALGILDQVEKQYGVSLTLFIERRRYAQLLNDKELADAAKKLIARVTPQSAWDFYAIGRALYRGGQIAAAAEALQNAGRMKPHDFWIHFTLGRCFGRLNRHMDAAHAYSVCIGRNPNNANSFAARGEAYSHMGNWAVALNDFQHALRLNPNRPDIHFQRAIVYRKCKKYDLAHAELVLAQNCGAQPAIIHFQTALVYRASGDAANARKSAQAALRQNPNFADAVRLSESLAAKLDSGAE